jgi:hypothetical protein
MAAGITVAHLSLGAGVEVKLEQVFTNRDLDWVNPGWLATLTRMHWANAAIDSAQVTLQIATASELARVLAMQSLPSSSKNNLSSMDVWQKRITVSSPDSQ